jgi:DNA helicase-2/ATP-dependent DNA helicase PcrA
LVSVGGWELGRTPTIVAEELALLEQVTRLLGELPERRGPSEAALVEELERLREQILSRRDSQDAISLNEQWHRQNALLQQLRTSRASPKVDPRSPYFGHLGLRENGQVRDLCVGHATCVEGGVRIVDWRNAPVSRLFYRYGQGDEYDEEIAGRRRVGRVETRRTVAIRDGCLERVEAPEGVFAARAREVGGWRRVERVPARLAGGEGSALRAHAPDQGRDRRLTTDALEARIRADKRLQEITGLIDPSQFDLITRPRPGFLVIRGAAGSGKTTVALHRIAYLAYEQPEIDSASTLFVVLSPGLRHYVSHVLPSLGVREVAVCTFADWAGEQRRRHFPALPAEVRDDAPALVQRIKLHPALDAALEAQVARAPGPPIADQALDDWASALSDRELLARVFEERAPGAFRPEALASFAAWNRERVDEMFQALAGDPEAGGGLEPEDDALLLRAFQLRVGPLRAPGGRELCYRHVAVDEVQDFSPLEIRTLVGCLDGARSLTLAGDTQQQLVEASGFTSWSRLLDELGVPGAEIETLRVSYRSSREIMTFARGVLGELAEGDEAPQTARRGPPVELFRFTARGACVAFLAQALHRLAEEEPLASVAVLTPSPEASALYHEGLAASDLPRLRRVEQQEFTFSPGVEVTEIEQAKGLEFDYVIAVDVTEAAFPAAPSARRRLHVAATRAVHQLWLTCVGTPSPLVAAAVGSAGG